jgi:hypothetical protein
MPSHLKNLKTFGSICNASVPTGLSTFAQPLKLSSNDERDRPELEDQESLGYPMKVQPAPCSLPCFPIATSEVNLNLTLFRRQLNNEAEARDLFNDVYFSLDSGQR